MAPRSSRAATARSGSLDLARAHGDRSLETSRANHRADARPPLGGTSQPPTKARPPSAPASERKAPADSWAKRSGACNRSPVRRRSASHVMISLTAQGTLTEVLPLREHAAVQA
eukprot:14178903-Alexandrium_andersonii.AAC.1